MMSLYAYLFLNLFCILGPFVALLLARRNR
jgi:hypothetical protein